VRQGGAATVAQDEDSCVVFGMPHEAIKWGAVQHGLRLDSMPGFVARSDGRAGSPRLPVELGPQLQAVGQGATARRSSVSSLFIITPCSLYGLRMKCVAVESTPWMVASFSETNDAT